MKPLKDLILALIPFGAMNVIAIVLSLRAHRHLAAGAPHPLWVMILGGLAKREYFTETGWTLRVRAIRWHSWSIVPSAAILAFC